MTTHRLQKTRSNDRKATMIGFPLITLKFTPSCGVVISRKFVDGIEKYKEHWDGPITLMFEPAGAVPSTSMDDAEYDPVSLPFDILVMSFLDPKLGQKVAGHRLAVGGTSHRQHHFPALFRSAGVPFIYITECSLKTRLHVVRSGVRNPVIALRRQWWGPNQERKQRETVRLASAIQCNGTPTFEAYRSLNSDALLFFDSRIMERLLISDNELAARAQAVKKGDPLRITFSGRLISMKGADHLLKVAAELRRLGVPFELTICGGGEVEARLKADIVRLHLSDCAKLAGILDFRDDLVPLIKHETDLFLRCHCTGDPSCTYLEVLSCGVPIVGYDNEAFQGMVRESGAGWLSPMNRPERLAARIAELSRDRAALLDASRRAAEFSRRHTFERTFKTRLEHMMSCAAARQGR